MAVEQTLQLNVVANVSAAKKALSELSRMVSSVSKAASSISNGSGKTKTATQSATKAIEGTLDAVTAKAKKAKAAVDDVQKSVKGVVADDSMPAKGAAGAAKSAVEFNRFGGKRLQELIDSRMGIGRYANTPMNASQTALADILRAEEAADRVETKISKGNPFKNFIQGITAAQKRTSGFSHSLSHLMTQFKRIATYRVFKAVLKGITDSFKVGTQNLVQYSAAMNGLDAAAANPTMSTFATQLLYVRNSIGAAAMPALQALVPVVQTVAGWFVSAANAVNQFISILQGKTTFTKAKEYAVDYAESLGGVGSAAGKAAKELQQLMDFDEINNIISPKDSGGGGGGGAGSGMDYSQMFEEANIDLPWLNAVKGVLDDIEEVALAIGGAILAWAVGSKLTEFGGVLSALGNVLKLAAGITLVITGVELAFKGGQKIAMADNAQELIAGVVESALGTLAAGLGGSLITSALGFGTGVGWAIGISIGLVATLAGVIVGTGKERFEDSDLSKYLDDLKQKCETITKDSIDAFNRLNEKISEFDSISRDKRIAESLLNRLYELQEQGTLSASEIGEVNAITELLDDLGLDGIKAEYDGLKLNINKTKEEAYDALEAFMAQAQAEAVLQLLKEAEYDHAEAAQWNTEAIEAQQKATEEFDKAEQALTEFMEGRGYSALMYLSPKYWELKEASDAAKETLDAATTAVDESAKAMDASQDAIDFYSDDLANLQKKARGASDEVKGVGTATDNLNGKSASVSIHTSGMDNANSKLRDMLNYLTNIGKKSSIHISASGNVHGGISGNFASGGFPTQGSLFLAGETAGQTEWLGDVNGKTGVVSGNEITGIADAIYAASERETRTLGGLLRQIAQKELTITPSAGLGRVNAQSAAMYSRVTGA